MKYEYWKVVAPEDHKEPWVRRPVVLTTLEGPSRALEFEALVDSGSEYSLFHTDIAMALGIDLNNCDRSMISGIENDPTPSYITDVKVTVEGLQPATIPVMFWERQPIALLGQVGFFDLHSVLFERHRDVFEITPVSTNRH